MSAGRDLNLPRREGSAFGYPVKGGVRLFGRALVALTAAGQAVPAGTAGAVAIAGIAESQVDNRDGADGTQTVNVLRETRGFEFAADFADIGKVVFAVDDNTITLDGSGGKLRVGVITGIGDGRTWVSVGA